MTSQSPRILVVDEEGDARDALHTMMTLHYPHVHVVTAACGEAMNYLIDDQTGQVVLVISGWDMPSGSGGELLHFIRQVEGKIIRQGALKVGNTRLPFFDLIEFPPEYLAYVHHIPVVIVAQADTAVQQRALRAGANAFLDKPCPPATLLAAIQSFIPAPPAAGPPSQLRQSWLQRLRAVAMQFFKT